MVGIAGRKDLVVTGVFCPLMGNQALLSPAFDRLPGDGTWAWGGAGGFCICISRV